MIHVVSDLRAVDWATDGPAIQDLLRECKDSGITVHLFEVANRGRKTDRKTRDFHENIAFV